MFYGRSRIYKVEKPVTEKDRTGFETTTYKDAGTAAIYIVEKGANAYRTNELHLTESQFVGYTRDLVEVGSRIDSKYVVDYVSRNKGNYHLSLSAIG